MTNTLTWDIKFPIALPKINTNLLSVISLILLLTMAFLTTSAIADHCADKERDVLKAELAVYLAGLAVAAWVAAIAAAASGGPLGWPAIAGLALGLQAAKVTMGLALLNLQDAKKALEECEKSHQSADSGGCGSGGCGSG